MMSGGQPMTTPFTILPFLLALSVPVFQDPAETPEPSPAVCCFTNPGFSGVCRVTPAPGETCASILGFLNDPRATGKAYCNATDVRGNWKTIDCKGKPPAKE